MFIVFKVIKLHHGNPQAPKSSLKILVSRFKHAQRGWITPIQYHIRTMRHQRTSPLHWAQSTRSIPTGATRLLPSNFNQRPRMQVIVVIVMSKWAEGRSHVAHLVETDRDPQKEEAMLVFQSLVIIWCAINNYPARLLKKFTLYDFVNFVKKGNGHYVCAVTDGNKYKFRRALKFNEFEQKVMTFYFKRVPHFG